MNGFILDTNVISEMMRKRPASSVLNWLDSIETSNLWLATITITEIQRGILLLNEPERVDFLRQQFQKLLRSLFQDRVISYDEGCANQSAQYLVQSKKNPKHHLADSMIAGSALFHQLGVATRNMSDFDQNLIEVFNPWDFGSE